MDDRAYTLERNRQVIRHNVLYLEHLGVRRVLCLEELLELLDLGASRYAGCKSGKLAAACRSRQGIRHKVRTRGWGSRLRAAERGCASLRILRRR